MFGGRYSNSSPLFTGAQNELRRRQAGDGSLFNPGPMYAGPLLEDPWTHTRPTTSSNEASLAGGPLATSYTFSTSQGGAASVEHVEPISKTPTYEFYGFVLYLLSFLCFSIFFTWAYLPDHILHFMGISYYFSRYWALAIPAYGMVLLLAVLVGTGAWGLAHTPSFDSVYTITDEHATLTEKKRSDGLLSRRQAARRRVEQVPEDYIPELQDIPLHLVNATLFGKNS